jgi:histidinol-phosphate aminotransferase
LPFEPSTLAEALGIAALGDDEFLRRSIELNAVGIRQLSAAASELGLPSPPSAANFIMLEFPSAEEASRVAESMLAEGVIVRPLRAFGLPQCLRISTGTEEENALCVEALRRSYAGSITANGAR